MNILIIKLSSIGDIVHTLPSLVALRSFYPQSWITWVVEEEASDLLKDNPLLNETISLPLKKWKKNLKNLRDFTETIQELLTFLKKIRSRYYDIVLDFQGLFKSGLITFFTHGKRKIGYNHTRELSYLFLNEKVNLWERSQHAIDRYLNLLAHLGIKHESISFPLALNQEVKDNLYRLFRENRIKGDDPLIALHPWARWQSKLWGEYNFAKLADLIIENLNAQVIFLGSKENLGGNTKILSLMQNKAYDLTGKTSLRELAFLLSLCKCLVTVDSGPLHIAIGVNTPVIALFGPTAPWRTGPYSLDLGRVIYKNLPCSPCFKKECRKPKCMECIEVSEVFEVLNSEVINRKELVQTC